MKWFGAVLAILSTISVAHYLARPYRFRISALEQWIRLLEQLVPAIGWKKLPLQEAFSEASRGYPLLTPVLRKLNQLLNSREMDFFAAFSGALREESWIWDEDRRILEELGRVLGRSSSVYQEDHIKGAISELQRVLQEARGRGLKQARLVESLTSAAGIALVILLL